MMDVLLNEVWLQDLDSIKYQKNLKKNLHIFYLNRRMGDMEFIIFVKHNLAFWGSLL